MNFFVVVVVVVCHFGYVTWYRLWRIRVCVWGCDIFNSYAIHSKRSSHAFHFFFRDEICHAGHIRTFAHAKRCRRSPKSYQIVNVNIVKNFYFCWIYFHLKTKTLYSIHNNIDLEHLNLLSSLAAIIVIIIIYNSIIINFNRKELNILY